MTICLSLYIKAYYADIVRERSTAGNGVKLKVKQCLNHLYKKDHYFQSFNYFMRALDIHLLISFRMYNRQHATRLMGIRHLKLVKKTTN